MRHGPYMKYFNIEIKFIPPPNSLQSTLKDFTKGKLKNTEKIPLFLITI